MRSHWDAGDHERSRADRSPPKRICDRHRREAAVIGGYIYLNGLGHPEKGELEPTTNGF
jgi:hypothetical protein